jgi:RNase P protein component
MTEFKDNILAAKAFVVVVKPAVIDLSYEDMRTKLAVLLKKSKLMENEND